MDINKVIQLGDIPELFHGWFTLTTFIIFTVIFVLIIFIPIFLVFFEIICDLEDLALPMLFVMTAFLGVGTIIHGQQKDEYNNKVSEWRTTYAKPYIESLPKEKKKLSLLKSILNSVLK